ncbi:hypothetical protein BG58_11065 [Caballeronia jiangsuensis]|nr:hypothetical protein BG58_11065 [Caballeronia jiangsuensis]
MQIYFVDALAGAGKTTAAIKHALAQVEIGAKVAIVQPSTQLIDQTYNALVKSARPKTQITKYHTQCADSVKTTVSNHLRAAAPGVGEILLISHQTFLTLPYWHNAKDWDVIIDELPQIEDDWTANLPVNHAAFTSHVEVRRDSNKYCQITTKAGSETEVQRMAECLLNDQQDKIYQTVCQKLHNPQAWTTYVNVESWDKVVSGEEMGKHQITTFSLLKPQSFNKYRTVTIMGAMFKDSVLYLLWQREVEFIEHAAIASNLSMRFHTNGELLTIKYLFDGTWSKTLKETKIGSVTVANRAREVIEELMGEEMFLYAANTTDAPMDLGIRVANVCHGLNKYKHIHNVVFFSALNASPQNYAFMGEVGVSPELLRRARGYQTLYQTIMRTSLRNPADTNSKTVVVMDKESAEYLSLFFPGCAVEQIENAPEIVKPKRGRKKTGNAKSNAERTRKCRELKKAQQQQNGAN